MNRFEPLHDALLNFPHGVMVSAAREAAMSADAIYYHIARLIDSDQYTNDEQKRNVAINIMRIIDIGLLRLGMYGIGYSIGHINFIIADLRTKYENVLNAEADETTI